MKIKKIDSFYIVNAIISSSLFLFAMNFAEKSNTWFLLFLILCLFSLIQKKSIFNPSHEFFLLICAFFSYYITTSIIMLNVSNQFPIGRLLQFLIAPILAYFFGYILPQRSTFSCKTMFFSLAFGTFFHGALNYFYSLNGGLEEGQRNGLDVWSDEVLSATHQGALFTMCSSLLFYGLFIEKSKKLKIIIVLSTMIGFLNALNTATRTLVYLTILMFILNIFLYLYFHEFNKKVILKLLFVVIFCCFFVVLLYIGDVFNMKSTIENSSLFSRLTSDYHQEYMESGDPRFTRMVYMLQNMIYYPLGGNHMHEVVSYAHNLWLDAGDDAGIVVALLLFSYSLSTTFTVLKLITKKNVPTEEKYICFSLYTGLMINFMLEPVLQGFQYLFISLCVLNGGTRYLLDESIKQERRLHEKNTLAHKHHSPQNRTAAQPTSHE